MGFVTAVTAMATAYSAYEANQARQSAADAMKRQTELGQQGLAMSKDEKEYWRKRMEPLYNMAQTEATSTEPSARYG